MKYQFDEEKATQASAYLLKKYGGNLNYMKLIKMLYIANRKSIVECGEPIVPDLFVSMKQGPVLSGLLDKINYACPETTYSYWSEFLGVASAYTLHLKKNPGFGKLSRRALRILDEVDLEWHEKSQFDIVKWTHDSDNIPEWTDPGDSSYPICLEKLFSVLGKTQEETSFLIREEKEYQKESEFFDAQSRRARESIPC